jgi:glycosyltransferase involved in cell wall biosynthesis
VADPIRVLWLIKGLGPGGAERLLVDAAAHVDRSRFDYRAAYLLPWKDHLVADLKAADILVRCLDMRRAIDPSWLFRLRRLVTQERIDLVHAHLPSAAIGARLALTGPARPAIVSTEHNLWSRHRPLTRRLNVWTFARQDAVIAVSEGVRGSMGTRSGPPVSVIPNGVDIEQVRALSRPREEARADLGLPEGVPVVGTVGGVTPKKGHIVLVEAARAVLTAVPDARFVIVGLPADDGPVRAAIRAAGIEDRVTLAGYREHAAQLMPAFDVFCLPSLFEGMPVSLLEAMTQGLPIVATDVGGVPEVATNERDALLVPAADAGALAGALLRLLDDADLCNRLGGTARTTAERFDIRTMVRRTEAVYSQVMETRR